MDYTIAALEAEMPGPEMNGLVTEILASALSSIGLFTNGIGRLAGLTLDKPPAPYYERWLDRAIRHLQEQGMLTAALAFSRPVRPPAELWEEWEQRVAAWASNPNRQAQTALLRACLEGLPGVLSGRQRATDVMFPNSSMHLVEGVYRGNPQADYFNDVLGTTLSACIEQQLQSDPQRTFRIIEIGAGTGGTTAALLPAVRRYPVEEYCYTDISKAFLLYAEKQFQPRCPVLTTAIFDVSRPLDSQSVIPNHYDFAIAANVLHATADIRETLRNAKAVLKNQGVLLLNEIATWSLFNHLTFGLLEGWWLYEDEAVRLPGSPGLAPEKWREVLAVEGFESIVFPAEEAHGLGQQIVAAVSNGWTRQRIVNDVRPPMVEPAGPAAPAPSSPSAPVGQPAAVHARQVITAKLSDALRMDAGAIASDAPFADFGVDSIIGVNLVRTIGEALQIELETTSLFEYSTVEELAQYILKKWPAEIAALVEETPGSAPAGIEPGSEERSIGTTRFAEAGSAFDSGEDRRSETSGHEPIAIIGMSGRFAESESLDAFWQHLAQGHDLVKEVSRWSPEECARTESSRSGACSRGSFIDSIDRFDAAFFGISALEATYMDPQQRLFLEESWSALEDAGYAGAGVHEKQCGVYVGCGAAGYDELVPADAPAQAFWGNSQAVVPARIAYSLNLQGPAIAIDTACSSSLVAIHLACQGLWAGETEMAVAGGVFLQATPGFYQAANRAGMLSPDGKCHSFDARANGFVPGEGVGAVVLKRLRDAVADGDNIHGVIAGSAINQDGRSNGLIAPNGRAQERLERLVYERFKIDPSTIQVVEAHATGTLLGDSVEYAALSRAFGDAAGKGRSCALGTVKTNIGHASTASGIAGVLKILLSLRHRQIPPSLHFEKGNPAIDFGSGPFYVNTELKAWDAGAGGVRRGAVSSFGFSGTNAHLIIEEAPAVVRRTVVAPAYLIVLSARSGGQLKQQVLDLLAHLEGRPGPAMTDLSFSLFAGRTHFAHRLACVARNREELMQLLGQWVESGAAGRVYAAEVQEGRVREHAALARLGNRCIHECRNATAAEVLENLTAIADLYVQGYSLDFQALFSGDAKRVPLPTYPFARERYWAGAVSDAAPKSPVARSARLHPLLHTKPSTLGQQSYRCTLTGAELFLRGALQAVPEAAYLEMARAAMEQAACIPQGSSVVELQDVVWAEPLLAGETKEMTIALFAAGGEGVGYEIYSGEGEREVVHCRGRASFDDQSAPAKVDLDALRRQMQNGAGGQLFAHVSLPAGERWRGGEDCGSGYGLHPSLWSDALRAASALIAGNAAGTARLPCAAGRVRILLPCTEEEVFVWARRARGSELDVDLIDGDGNVCVQMRGLSFSADEPAERRAWLFAKHASIPRIASMGAVETMTLFLKDEAALQLQKTIEEIPTDRSFFDLGLTSLGMTNLVQNTCRLLDENLSPSVLFEYRDIESLAAHLATAYPAAAGAVTAVRQGEDPPDTRSRLRARAVRPPQAPRPRPVPEEVSGADVSLERILESVSFQEASVHDGYEKVTF